MVGGLRRSAAERARGADRRLERDAARRSRRGSSRRAPRSRINRADRYPQVTTSPSITREPSRRQPRERHGAPARLGLPAAGRRLVRGRRVGPGAATRVDASRARGAGERRGSRDASGCRCTPSSRSTTSSCAASTPSKRILDAAVAAFERALELTRNRFAAASRRRPTSRWPRRSSRPRARRRSTSIVRRAALEHAIAVLVGKHPRRRSRSPSSPLDRPAARRSRPGCPSDLLERRPDIAAAERRVAAANAERRRGAAPRSFRGCC